ncbi:hypothetical protein Taro_010863 [Colocasia esculenta]|uniref:Uncharacterized protein n=1 Tax=Colocasia esculenta TaxID=4460 RepID=A0A843UAX5_COLES|nr:hypothetical protein [Colocasia esculenta]
MRTARNNSGDNRKIFSGSKNTSPKLPQPFSTSLVPNVVFGTQTPLERGVRVCSGQVSGHNRPKQDETGSVSSDTHYGLNHSCQGGRLGGAKAPLKRQGASLAALKHLVFLRVEKAPQGAAKAANAHARGAWARLDPLGVRNIPLRQQIQNLHFGRVSLENMYI